MMPGRCRTVPKAPIHKFTPGFRKVTKGLSGYEIKYMKSKEISKMIHRFFPVTL